MHLNQQLAALLKPELFSDEKEFNPEMLLELLHGIH